MRQKLHDPAIAVAVLARIRINLQRRPRYRNRTALCSGRCALNVGSSRRQWESLPRVVEVLQSEPELLAKLVQALVSPGRFTRCLNRWQQQSHQDADDC